MLRFRWLAVPTMLPFRFTFFCEAIVPSSRGNAYIEGELYFISASFGLEKRRPNTCCTRNLGPNR